MINKKLFNDLLDSLSISEGVNSTASLLEWIRIKNNQTKAKLYETSLSDDSFWFLDKDTSSIRNRSGSFFRIVGIKNGNKEQPIIFQNEVGYLGFIGKRINGIIHFLMQAKIEPGNVNNVQISPTIQATKSNFTQLHGGRAPHYLNYFKNVNEYTVIYDGEEPEQCSRFYKKYNRNVIILVDDNHEIPILDDFKWMTIGQIKTLATNYKNLVNMDTRTVMSCIPYDLGDKAVSDNPFLKSIFECDESDNLANMISVKRSELKESSITRLDELIDWRVDEKEIVCRHQYPFLFKFFDITIEGREVTHWTQPLAVANGSALFALGYIVVDSTMFFAIKMHEEIGCDGGVCFGPTIQFESPYCEMTFENEIQKSIYCSIMNDCCDIKTILSEEGGRFFHEENLNVVCEIDKSISKERVIECGYFLVTYKTIRRLIEKTHAVNIQLRNLLSLLRCKDEKN